MPAVTSREWQAIIANAAGIQDDGRSILALLAGATATRESDLDDGRAVLYVYLPAGGARVRERWAALHEHRHQRALDWAASMVLGRETIVGIILAPWANEAERRRFEFARYLAERRRVREVIEADALADPIVHELLQYGHVLVDVQEAP